MQGDAFKYKEKTLECFTLSHKLPSKYNRIFMHVVGKGSIFIPVQSFFDPYHHSSHSEFAEETGLEILTIPLIANEIHTSLSSESFVADCEL